MSWSALPTPMLIEAKYECQYKDRVIIQKRGRMDLHTKTKEVEKQVRYRGNQRTDRQTCDISMRLDEDVVLAQSPASKYQSNVVAGRLHCLDDVARPVLSNIQPSGNTGIIIKQHTRFLIGITNSKEII